MIIDIELNKQEILKTVKTETYLLVKSSDYNVENNEQRTFHMIAGDDAVHERKLLNSIGVALSAFKSEMNAYDIEDTLTKKDDDFTLSIEVSDRFNMNRANDVQRLVEEYICRKVTADWWQANLPNMAAPYDSSAQIVLDNIRKCFTLTKPFERDINDCSYQCIHHHGYRMVRIFKENLLSEVNAEMLKLAIDHKDERGVANLQLQTNEVTDGVMLTRYINKHAKRVAELLVAYTDRGGSTQLDSDQLERTDVYDYRLFMPRNWDDRLFEQLASEIHTYIVSSVLQNYLKTILPDLAGVYADEAVESEMNIKHIISKRKYGSVQKPNRWL